jgi:hypothetical protein
MTIGLRISRATALLVRLCRTAPTVTDIFGAELQHANHVVAESQRDLYRLRLDLRWQLQSEGDHFVLALGSREIAALW